MRAASWIVWLVAVGAGTFTVPMLWVSHNIASEDGWVGFTAGFVQDDELRDAVISVVSGAALAQTALPSAVAGTVQQAFEQIVRTAAQRPGFVDAWRESLRRTHRLTFDSHSTSDRLIADIGPLATFVVRDVSKDLPVPLTVPDSVKIPIYESPNPDIIRQVSASSARAKLGLTVASIAMAVSMLMAGSVGGAMCRLGFGLLAVAAVVFATTGFAVPTMLERAPAGTEFAKQMRDLLVAHTSASFNAWALTLAVLGGLGAAGGLVLGTLRRGG